jgi:large subunit ribosomal protein L32e
MAEAKTKKAAAKKPEKKAESKAAAKKPQKKAESKAAAKKPEKKAHEKPTEKKAEHKAAPKKPAQEKAKEEPHDEDEFLSAAKPKAAEAKPKKEEAKVKKEIPITKIQFLQAPVAKPDDKGKPKFIRQEGGRYKRLADVWRRPTGIDSKKLEKKRGKGSLPSIGYKKPAAESGLQSGLEAVRVFNPDDLKKVTSGKQAAVIAAAVGRRKRNMIIEEANRLKIAILNPRRGEA